MAQFDVTIRDTLTGKGTGARRSSMIAAYECAAFPFSGHTGHRYAFDRARLAIAGDTAIDAASHECGRWLVAIARVPART